jgi:Stress responsive A/B Barrel Domain
MFIHVVYFWCKEGTSDSAKQEMIRYSREEMPKVSSIVNVWAGRAVASDRDVVDSSYDVGLCVVFKDKAGHDLYQPHEIHQEFIRRFKDHWAKVAVRDFE